MKLDQERISCMFEFSSDEGVQVSKGKVSNKLIPSNQKLLDVANYGDSGARENFKNADFLILVNFWGI